jgi:probable HAF family extracellular repeat protein
MVSTLDLIRSVLLAILCTTNCIVAAELKLIPLGNLGGASEFGKSSQAYGISRDGRAVVGDSLATVGLGVTRGVEAFLWVQGGSMRGLGALDAENHFSTAWDASLQGRVVVGESQTATSKQAFRWTPAKGMQSLGTLPDHDRSIAYSVSDDGDVIVGASSSPYATLAYRWTLRDGMVSLGDLPGGSDNDNSSALAVSSDGTVIVGRASSHAGTEAFRWTRTEGMKGLGDLPGGRFASAAYGVSGGGRVVVGQSHSKSGSEAFRWTADSGMVGLGDLPGGGFSSAAFGVSADGNTIVGQAATENGPEAFIWTANGGMRSLNELLRRQSGAQGWQLREARDVSDDGLVMAGIGRDPEGETAAWLIRITADKDATGRPQDQ